MNRRLSFRAIFVALLCVAAAAASGCDIATADLRARAADEWKRTYTLAAGGRVEISNVNGRIAVEPGEGNTVEIRAERRARAATEDAAKARLQQVEIKEEEVSPSAIRIATKVPRGGGLFEGGSVEIEYHVRVPVMAEVRMRTVNGGVELSGLRGRVDAETVNGGITGKGLTGPIVASTTNGGVEMDVDAVGDNGIKLECTNGGIKLRLPRTVKASLSARITNGGIDIGDLSIERIGQSSRRRLEGQLNGGGPRIELEGTNGGIELSGK